MQFALGLKKDEKVEDNIGFRMDEYEGTKAILYDRDGNQIAFKTLGQKVVEYRMILSLLIKIFNNVLNKPN